MVDNCLNPTWKGYLYDEVNEGYFFHGTKRNGAENLLKQGLEPRMSHGETVLGPVIYMAESSTKADQYADDISKRQREGLQMFLVRACLGEACTLTEARKLKRPPCCMKCFEDDSCDNENRYDSVVLDQFIFREFVVYESSLVYPEYLITYDRVA
ncbi:poly [ADP-ribose] polymerase tankyrase-like [Mercenaria mercenaria]|uniref:poly [ADP-ribose] polymerase tankyrase-like n=1 Tax=Mercenaria mercenaria TaxID=6596 RepID=UPI00234E6172|nr:poly [ADP-ribose] polymerase tankyrase-like [Mercenaria mercenaria]